MPGHRRAGHRGHPMGIGPAIHMEVLMLAERQEDVHRKATARLDPVEAGRRRDTLCPRSLTSKACQKTVLDALPNFHRVAKYRAQECRSAAATCPPASSISKNSAWPTASSISHRRRRQPPTTTYPYTTTQPDPTQNRLELSARCPGAALMGPAWLPGILCIFTRRPG